MAEVCKFFLQGRCAYGNVCRFAHTAPGGRGDRRGPDAASSSRALPAERRIDPEDGKACTFDELSARYFGVYAEDEIREYWTYSCPLAPVVEDSRARPGASAGRVVCRHFLTGSCSFGDACRNLHVVDVSQLDEGLEAARQRRAPAAAGGAASSAQPQDGGAAAPPPPPPKAAPKAGRGGAPIGPAVGSSAGRHPPQQAYTGEAESGECGICFENIAKKGERFGMLESCDHAFCLSCIRSWRKQREQQDRVNLRMCPVCRNESFFVVPCEHLILDPQEKAAAVADYKLQMSKVPCKAFNYGQGTCPFGTSCFYAHLNPDGTRFTPAPKRRMAGKDGVHVREEVKLSDFFG